MTATDFQPAFELREGEVFRLLNLAPLSSWAHQVRLPAPLQAAPCATLADLVGPALAIAAGDVAEALETARQWPLDITGQAIVLADADDTLDPAVRITAQTPDGTEITITVALTGRTGLRPWNEEER